MKILVLGGSGLIGNMLLEKTRDNFEVIATYNKNSISTQFINSKKISLPDEFEHLSEYITQENPNVVIDTIAYSNPEFSEKNKTKVYQLHVENVRKLCKVCHKNKSKLIFLSTDYVFDGEKGKYTEEDIPNPINYYGETKYLAEKNVLKDSNNVVVRTSLVYGWHSRVRFLNFVLYNLTQNKEIQIMDDVYFSPTLLDDLIEGLQKIISSDMQGIFHIAGSSCVSKFQFACYIAKKFNLNENLVKPLSIRKKQENYNIPKNTCLDSTKIKRVFNLELSNIDEGLSFVLAQSKQQIL